VYCRYSTVQYWEQCHVLQDAMILYAGTRAGNHTTGKPHDEHATVISSLRFDRPLPSQLNGQGKRGDLLERVRDRERERGRERAELACAPTLGLRACRASQHASFRNFYDTAHAAGCAEMWRDDDD